MSRINAAAKQGWVVVLACASAGTHAQTVELPLASCATDVTFAASFETPATELSAADVTRSVAVPSWGNKTYHLHRPARYQSGRAWSVLWVLHGAAGSPAAADAAARTLRDAWSALADAQAFLVVAPVANGASGGWATAADIPMLTAIAQDLDAQFRLEHTRQYLWGYSAGGHYAHGLALHNPEAFAAYAVSAGALHAYACAPEGSDGSACSVFLPGVMRKLPVVIGVGWFDPLYAEVAGDPMRFVAAGWDVGQVHYQEWGGGHEYAPAQFAQTWSYLCRYALSPDTPPAR